MIGCSQSRQEVSMYPELIIPPRGALALIADSLVLPFMAFIAPKGESPQLTHYWNNIDLDDSQIVDLQRVLMAFATGDPEAKPRKSLLDVRFHMGGWPNYVVLEPIDYIGTWYVGWITPKGAGASQVPIGHRVRMLRGPDETAFFGITQEGRQIPLRKVGEGKLGDGGRFGDVPLH